MLEKIYYFYTKEGKIDFYLSKWWDNDLPLIETRVIYTYNSNGKISQKLTEYIRTENQWVNYTRYSYTYNSDGSIFLYLDELWDGNQWVNQRQITYSYDIDGNNTMNLYGLWIDNLWVNLGQILYTYDSNKNCTLELQKNWINNSWINIEQYIYAYDSFGNMTTRTQEWSNGNDWIFYSERNTTYLYDSNKNKILESWDYLFESGWTNKFRTTYSYDSFGNLTSLFSEEREDSNWKLIKQPFSFTDQFENDFSISGSEMNIYYSTLTDIEETENIISDYSLSQNYPNPFNPSTTIKYSISSNVKDRTTNVSLKVFDILGKEVATLVNNKEQNAGNYEVQFNASGLSSGIYFYKLQSGNFVESRKMIILR